MQFKTDKNRIFFKDIALETNQVLNSPTVTDSNPKIEQEKRADQRRERTGLALLGGGSAALEDLKLDEAERHEAEGQPRHYPGEEDEEARGAGVDAPPQRSEGDVLALDRYHPVAHHHRPSHR